ncbi:MAG: response regulator [Desulfobacteraceae bacterium]|nr:response regulator [Desulfobacteraceae bacterium]
MTKPTAIVLAVDDETYNLKIISYHLKDENFEVVTAGDGVEAWDLLTKNPERFDTILLDRSMPRMSGMEVLKKIKLHDTLKTIPVIFQTAMKHQDDILEGLQAGAYYYLTKPYKRDDLRTIVNAAVSDSIKYKKLKDKTDKVLKAFAYIKKGEFEVFTPQQGEQLSALLSSACPEPRKVVVGLWELILNGIEHGNLGISYDEKSKLNKDSQWASEIQRRLSLSENKAKSVEVHMNRYESDIEFIVQDQGDGFDWQSYLDISPERAFDSHGRGIAMACMYSFDKVEYHGNGNIVSAVVSLNSETE